MSSVVQGLFISGAAPQNGAAAKLWKKAAFADPGPAYNAAEPAPGNQVGATVTTGTTHGGTGAYRFTAIDEGDYWLSVEYLGNRTWEAVHVGTPENVIAPDSFALPADVSAIAGTETDVLSRTLTAPPVAGQIHVIAHMHFYVPSFAGDVFKARLYINGVEKAASQHKANSITDEWTITLAATAAVSGSIVIKTTVQRVGGTGNINVSSLSRMTWIIFPAASVVV